MTRLRNKTVVVTGASAGVGRAIARRLAKDGARVGLIARDAEALEAVRREVEERGGTATVVAADVSDAGAVFAAADDIVRVLGPIEVWINNAMVTVYGPAWEITPGEYHRVAEVTYLGFVHGTLAALRHMRPADHGTIIQVGSALAYRGIPLQAPYCAAKAAIRGFTESLRSELMHAGSGVAVTMVELPAVNTPQFDWARTHMSRQPRPVAPVFQPEAVAEVVHRAALRPKREYWVGRSTFGAIFGNLLMPAFLDRFLAKRAWDAQTTGQHVQPGRHDNLMAPVPGLHRTRGSFGREAAGRAVALPVAMARLAPLVAAGAALIAAGYCVGWLAARED